MSNLHKDCCGELIYNLFHINFTRVLKKSYLQKIKRNLKKKNSMAHSNMLLSENSDSNMSLF